MKTASHTVTLTPAMLRNGYLDLPWSAKDMFPDDSFGSRTRNDTGSPVTLRFGSHHAMTDIRLKSSKTISPRKRLCAWFNTELRARPGDRFRIDRLDDRVFLVTHVASD